MGQKGENQKNDNSSGGHILCMRNSTRSATKKLKHKKVPQRGLGVAQLEKIRLEEQQNKPPGLPKPSMDYMPIRGCNNRNPSVSLPLMPSFSPKNHTPEAPQLVPNLDVFSSVATVPLRNGWSSPVASGHAVEIESSSSPYPQNFVLARDPNTIWSWPGLTMQTAQPCLQPSSSMVNVSPSTSVPSSTLLSLPVELPSNQSYDGNSTFSVLGDDKILAFTRSYPFLEEPSTGNSFGPRVRSMFYHPICKMNPETLSRDSTLSSTKLSVPDVGNDGQKHDPLGNFLTLAPPMASIQEASEQQHQLWFNSAGGYDPEFQDFESSHKSINVAIMPRGTGPLATLAQRNIGQEASRKALASSGVDAAEGLDLSLKL